LLPTALGLLLGLSGCSSEKQTSKYKDAAALPVPVAAEISPAPGGAEYTIKFKYKDIYKDSSPGDVAHITDTKTTETTSKLTDADGKVLNDDNSKGSETFVYTQTILEKPDKHSPPTRVRRQYERAEKKDGDKTTRMAFHGKSVLIEKKAGKWRFHYENGPELALEDAIVVYRNFHDDETVREEEGLPKMLLPKRPVKVGETWPLDAETIAKKSEKALLFRLDPAKAAGSGKLQRVYQQDGRQFGVLEFTLDMPIAETGKDKADEGSRLSQKGTIDGCIDGTSGTLSVTDEASATINGTLTEAGVKKGKLMMDMKEKHQIICKDLTKK
jgi:hypothetical protein